jgi:hypothetical protein
MNAVNWQYNCLQTTFAIYRRDVEAAVLDLELSRRKRHVAAPNTNYSTPHYRFRNKYG